MPGASERMSASGLEEPQAVSALRGEGGLRTQARLAELPVETAQTTGSVSDIIEPASH